jgi:predicted ATPase
VENVEGLLSQAVTFGFVRPEKVGKFEFVHDRVQQAMYSVLATNERQDKHLEFGLHLMTRLDKQSLSSPLLYDVLSHVKEGAKDPERLAKLEWSDDLKDTVLGWFQLGVQLARAATGYDRASAWAHFALRLVETWKNPWEIRHDWMLSFLLYLAEMECYTNMSSSAIQRYELLLSVEKSLVIRARIYANYILHVNAVGEMSRLCAVGQFVRAFQEFGYVLTEEAVPQAMEPLHQEIAVWVKEHGFDAISCLPDRWRMKTQELFVVLLTTSFRYVSRRARFVLLSSILWELS